MDKIFEKLVWDMDEVMQQKGMEEAQNIKELSQLILPSKGKSVWENCAKVLADKDDIELQPYYIELFEWLKDINWPGAERIYDRLLRIYDDKLLSAYEHSHSLAVQMEDSIWEQVLDDFLGDYVICYLDEANTLEKQVKGIELSRRIKNIKVFIRPFYLKCNKNVWNNCAIILLERTDEELYPYLVELVEWLQDMNWPGAFCIMERLRKYSDRKSLCNAINICLEKARACNDEVWKDNLSLLLSS